MRFLLFEALAQVPHFRCIDGNTISILAPLELAAEEIDAHDAEDEPEHKADKQDIEDGRNCLDQGIYDNLQQCNVPESNYIYYIRELVLKCNVEINKIMIVGFCV